jgi:basic membrane protein A
MAHDVFISHSSKDKIIADAVCAGLEARGIRCWIAPRDVLPGMEWTGAIVDAIANCKVFLLIFTDNSNQSTQALKEVDFAVNHEKTIIPFRLVDIKPTGSMEYYLGAIHWLDALTPPIEKHIEELANYIERILQVPLSQSRAEAVTPLPEAIIEPPVKTAAQPVPEKREKRKSKWWMAGLAAGLVIIGLGIFAAFKILPKLFSQFTQVEPTTNPISAQTVAIPPATLTAAGASRVLVCMVPDVGGIEDQSFNATAWKGVTDAQSQLGIEGRYLESQEDADYERNINTFVEQQCDLIVTVGYNLGDATLAAAEANPDVKFTIIDYSHDSVIPNLVSQIYNSDEAAFLAGYLAAGVTKTGKVATFGGMQVPPVTVFMDGFVRGVEYYNAKNSTNIVAIGWDADSQTGLFVDSWTDTQIGYDMAVSLMNDGVDIILPVAAMVGLGTASAILDQGEAYIIGVDTDMYFKTPEYENIILTSVIKRMDVTTLNVINSIQDGSFTGGAIVGNLANGGVGLAPFHNLDDVVSTKLKVQLEGVKGDIIAGRITINPFTFPQ